MCVGNELADPENVPTLCRKLSLRVSELCRKPWKEDEARSRFFAFGGKAFSAAVLYLTRYDVTEKTERI